MTGPSALTRERQALASDPSRSAWVSANAGSGKTYVLVQRVVRLLLAGADPSRILSLTFTKAAAVNMQNKVVERLRRWATTSDERLADELADLDGARPDATRLANARKLFARALETPGGLKIYTIHAFCGRLLHQFPFEANVAAGFSELDERDQAELMAQARAEVLAKAARAPGSAVGRALAGLAARTAEMTIDGALAEAVAERDAIRRLLTSDGIDGPDGAARELRALFELDASDSVAALEAAILGEGITESEWPAIAAELALGSTNDAKIGGCFARAGSSTSEAQRRACYLSAFLTSAGKPRASIVTAATRKRAPLLAERLDAELARLGDLTARLRALAIVERSHALLTLADAAIQAYAEAKSARGLLDYDDLISRARALLSRADAAWVLFKLDGGLDHVLVDEAQDTAPEQWDIVKRLTEDFLAGAGARAGVNRTIFAVGDEKQSIFSFQGAEPAAFGESRRHFETSHHAVELDFRVVPLNESFRSAQAVLDGVDMVFGREAARRGLTFDDLGTTHTTTRLGEAGSVELWPIATAEEAAYAAEAWDAPFDRANPASAVVRLAEAIAEDVQATIAAGRHPPGEILILVRQRKALFEAILRALKRRQIPVAGADRLVVGEHIAVMDLVALGDAIVTPDDDLALACALKGPLFGLTDEDLLAVAPRREGRLIDALAEGPPRAAAAAEKFRGYAKEAARRSPFDFYAHALATGGRRAFRARLGHEVDDPLDAFLDLAQDFSRTHPPSLPAFLHWMRAAPAEIKRDLDVSSGEVRVMTVHGAKGLEAGMVVLADTCGAATGRAPTLIMLPRPHAGHGAAPIPVWAGRKDDDPSALAAARADLIAKAQGEHRRLLYVAMTRAKDRLVVCGHDIRKSRPEGAWYDLVAEAMAGAPNVEAIERTDGGQILRLASGSIVAPAEARADRPSVPPEPDWLFAPAPHEAAPGRPLSPSAILAEDGQTQSFLSGPGADMARLRGVLLHRLLKALPDVAPERRTEAAAHIAASGAEALGTDAALMLAKSALAIVEEPAFAAVFGPDSRGEVPVVGRLRDGTPVSGRIDRLAVTKESVLVVDHKTDRFPPAPGAPVPPAYRAQLAAYAELIAEIWPDRPVRAAILWTAAPRIDEVALGAPAIA
ncbi:double-strand break repair helicase AddA [Chelatococcus sambhunathii]|uniref:DNA 3'-5' helicase n=1 Tax=Chelatococcus sambhunathii TaxID=363953 RepID=A0ABU1DKZ8_9HYPH|nr:double-strand break repair helicase AddA [Chelatococcus sambhunathii]MDR4308790.1 double-strand break repair helicase AddA [Chelatococcus sambhunathii]